MKYRLTFNEKLDGAEIVHEQESENLDYLKGQFDFYTMAEAALARMMGWETDEWENKRGWFFEAYDTENFSERRTMAQLVVVLD